MTGIEGNARTRWLSCHACAVGSLHVISQRDVRMPARCRCVRVRRSTVRQGRGCPTFSVRQPSASHNALRARVRPLCMHAWFYSVVSLATFSSCSLDSRPILPPDAGTSSMSNGTTTSAQTTASNVDAGTSSAAGNSDPNAASAQTGIGGISTPAQPAVAIPPPVDMDAGPARPSQPSTAQPTQPQGPATRPNTAVSKSCSRDTLQKRAAAYLQAGCGSAARRVSSLATCWTSCAAARAPSPC